MPKLAALSSPSRSAVSAQACRAKRGTAKSSTAPVIQTFGQVALVRLPIVQNTTAASAADQMGGAPRMSGAVMRATMSSPAKRLKIRVGGSAPDCVAIMGAE